MSEVDYPPFEKIDVGALLPQRPPFVLVDTLVHFDDAVTVCRYTVPDGGIFSDGGRLCASGLVENIAQTCAARLGFINTYILKCGVQVGFIGAIRDFRVYREPAVGEVLTTTIRVEESVLGMTLASATVCVGREKVAETSIKIAVKG